MQSAYPSAAASDVHPAPFPDVAPSSRGCSGVRAPLGSVRRRNTWRARWPAAIFDADSDIDFVVVTEQAVTDDLFCALRAGTAYRGLLAAGPSVGGLVHPRDALRRHGPAPLMHQAERGRGERASRWRATTRTGSYRYTLRGVASPRGAAAGYPHRSLRPNLRHAALAVLRDWWLLMVDDPAPLACVATSRTPCSLCASLRWSSAVASNARRRSERGGPGLSLGSAHRSRLGGGRCGRSARGCARDAAFICYAGPQ